MVFQTVGLYPHLTVYDNIVFPLKLKKVSSAVIAERVSAMVELLGIGHVVKRRIHEISGGERQRVAFAKALVKRPRLFLLDEPFSSLDAEIRRQLRTEIVRIHRELRTTMVFITHDQEEAMSIGDRVAVMNRGQLLQLDTPLRVYQWPATLWVARFIGTHPINVLNVSIDGGRLLTEGETPLALGAPPDFFKVGLASSKLALGIRPEALSLSTAEGASAGSLRAVVLMRQVMGNIILYELEFVNGLRLRALTPSAHDHAVGEQVSIGIQWTSVRLFDRDTGLLLGAEPSTAAVA
jgi:ABC-type sugar transport system ATPase subunit